MLSNAGRLFRACAPPVTAVLLAATTTAAPQNPRDQQPPTFRTGANLVRVDAYPMRDGKILEGLTADDFEVLEDGVPQKIETFEFVRYPRSSAVEERRDPNSQREGFSLAADPSYRVFVIYLDNLHVDVSGSFQSRAPLVHFLNRVLGPMDLFGVLTTQTSVKDLMLGQRTEFIEEQLAKHWYWGRQGTVSDTEGELIIDRCFYARSPRAAEELKRRHRIDEVFTDLEEVIAHLAGIREERKNILLVSDGWVLPGRATQLGNLTGPAAPGIGITDAGKLTLGRTNKHSIDPRLCGELLHRLSGMDFQYRLRGLLDLARQSNVTFYTIKPAGLTVARDHERTDALRVLSDNTDGAAVVNTNDLTGGAARIADHLSATYLLGYYPTNTKPDGRVRKITVRLKSSRERVRARQEYRAPSTEEVEAMRAAMTAPAAVAPPTAAEIALAELKRLRPAAVLHTRGAVVGDELVLTTELTAPEVEAGRWKQGGALQVMVTDGGGDPVTMRAARIEPGQRAAVIRVPLKNAPGPFSAAIRLRGAEGNAEDGVTVARPSELLGDPLVFRLATPNAPRPAGSVQFRRTERLQVRWPSNGALDRREVRVLGRDGVPLELTPTVTEQQDAGITFVVADLNLAPLTAGEYLLEATATRGGESSSSVLAFRVFR